MRLDSGNRSFFTLAATALVPYVLLGVLGCGVLSVAAYRLATEGPAGLQRNGQDLRPAVVFFGLVTAGTVVGALSVRRQVRATRALAAQLAERTAPAPTPVVEVATRAGLADRAQFVEDPDAYAFTYGLLPPRVVVSSGLVEALGPDELQAVLAHERYHVRNWDTVKVVVARAAPAAFFFLPALGHLRRRYLAGRELAADRQAVQSVGRRPLAGALHHVLDRPAWADFGAAAALGGSELLELRVSQIESGREPPLAPVPRQATAVTVAALVVLSGTFLLSVARVGSAFAGGSGPPDGIGSTVLSVLGGVACSSAWVAFALVLWRRGFGRRWLTRRARSTSQS